MTPQTQRFQQRSLQILLAAAIGFLLWGEARLWLDGISHREALTAFATLDGPSALLTGVIRAQPVALLCAGIAILVITPALRLILLVIDFIVQRDWTYTVICLAVAVVIAVGFALRLH